MLSETGKVLDEGQTEVGLGTYLVVPWRIGIAHGFPGGWEVGGTAGFFGSFDSFQYRNQELPGGQPMFGVDLGVTKAILDADLFSVSATGEFAAFGSSFRLEPGSEFAARLAAGVALGVHFTESVGLFAPARVAWLFGNHGNRVATFTPGLGLLLASEHFAFRLSGNIPLPFKLQADDGIHKLTPLPYLGLTVGYRW
jgi:hypothetical protein